jgi:hypothetical protein
VKIPVFSGNDVSAGDEGFAGTEVGSDLKISHWLNLAGSEK